MHITRPRRLRPRVIYEYALNRFHSRFVWRFHCQMNNFSRRTSCCMIYRKVPRSLIVYPSHKTFDLSSIPFVTSTLCVVSNPFCIQISVDGGVDGFVVTVRFTWSYWNGLQLSTHGLLSIIIRSSDVQTSRYRDDSLEIINNYHIIVLILDKVEAKPQRTLERSAWKHQRSGSRVLWYFPRHLLPGTFRIEWYVRQCADEFGNEIILRFSFRPLPVVPYATVIVRAPLSTR